MESYALTIHNITIKHALIRLTLRGYIKRLSRYYIILESQNGHIKNKKIKAFIYRRIRTQWHVGFCVHYYTDINIILARDPFLAEWGGVLYVVARRIVSSVILYYNAYTGHTAGNALVLSNNMKFYSIVRTEYSISDTQYKRQFARWKVSAATK